MSEFNTPKILHSRGDFLIALSLLLAVLSFSLTYYYQSYLSLKSFHWQSVDAVVIKQTTKKEASSSYFLLELKNQKLHFFTRSNEKLHELAGRKVHVVINTDNITFKGYLTRFFAYSKLLGVERNKPRRFQYIDKLHELHSDPLIANLYGALFFVEPISKALRNKLSALGINHLAALSGFHLGFLALLLIFILKLVLRPLQEYFYPYWHLKRMTMIITLLALFLYANFLDFTPSLIRAYVMLLLIFLLYDRGIKLRSFALLLFTVLIILVLFPYLFFSLGFWFSALGVMMIFLFLHHYPDLSTWKLALLINFGVFILMEPLILYIFHSVSPGQLLSPLLSLAFSLFYPLALLIHLLNIPTVLDDYLTNLFAWDFAMQTVTLNTWGFLSYLLGLIASIYSKRFFTALIILSTLTLAFSIVS